MQRRLGGHRPRIDGQQRRRRVTPAEVEDAGTFLELDDRKTASHAWTISGLPLLVHAGWTLHGAGHGAAARARDLQGEVVCAGQGRGHVHVGYGNRRWDVAVKHVRRTGNHRAVAKVPLVRDVLTYRRGERRREVRVVRAAHRRIEWRDVGRPSATREVNRDGPPEDLDALLVKDHDGSADVLAITGRETLHHDDLGLPSGATEVQRVWHAARGGHGRVHQVDRTPIHRHGRSHREYVRAIVRRDDRRPDRVDGQRDPRLAARRVSGATRRTSARRTSARRTGRCRAGREPRRTGRERHGRRGDGAHVPGAGCALRPAPRHGQTADDADRDGQAYPYLPG